MSSFAELDFAIINGLNIKMTSFSHLTKINEINKFIRF